MAETLAAFGRNESIDISPLHRTVDLLVVGDELGGRLLHLLRGHLFRFPPIPREPFIATRKRYCSGVVRPSRILGTSVTHADISLRGVSMGEAVLNGPAVESIRIVRSPEFVDCSEERPDRPCLHRRSRIQSPGSGCFDRKRSRML